MRIGVIQASSQAAKNQLLFDTVKKYAVKDEVINFGCKADEAERYSYVEIAVLAGLLLASESVDFIVTGCSSGQGMMLACNSFPGVLCGYAPSPMDAYLFAQINDGNAVSLPLGEEYTWAGYENFEKTIAKLFSEPFGQGYPKSEAARKIKDTRMLKEIAADRSVPRKSCWTPWTALLRSISCASRMSSDISCSTEKPILSGEFRTGKRHSVQGLRKEAVPWRTKYRRNAFAAWWNGLHSSRTGTAS